MTIPDDSTAGSTGRSSRHRVLLVEYTPQPGPPRRVIGWLRRLARPEGRLHRLEWRRIRVILYSAGVALMIGLGIWGFHLLRLKMTQLSWLQSTYDSVKLLTLDWGPAAGVGPGYRPNWQLLVALGLAVFLVGRAAWALVGARVRTWMTGHWLRNHVIVCGAGVHGMALAGELSNDCDVVVIDLDPQAQGLQNRGVHEWQVIGDATQASTLQAAGVARAAWVVAIAGDDVVNSQIVSTIATLRHRRDLLLLVQVEDPTLARFLEEDLEEELDLAGDGPSSSTEPRVISFSANAIAADWLLDNVGSPAQEIEAIARPHLILAGDHPLLDAVILAALRRWQAKMLRQLEVGDRSGLAAGIEGDMPPLRISVYGPGAMARVDQIERRWLPESQILQLDAKDTDPTETTVEADEWLHKRREADQAFSACWEEFDAITLTLGMARALGPGVPLTRITALPVSQLDEHIKKRAKASPALANVEVRQLAELGSGRQAMQGISQQERLTSALEQLGIDRGLASKQAEEVLGDGHQPVLRTDSGWHVSRSGLALVQPLVHPVPVSALVRARLAVDLNESETLRLTATKLSGALQQPDHPHALDAVAGWCEYVRSVQSQGDKSPEQARAELQCYPGYPIADTILQLAQAALGDRSAIESLDVEPNPLTGEEHVLIVAGGAGHMAPHTAVAMGDLLRPALAGYDGVLLSGGTSAGLPGIVGLMADELQVRAVGYLPEGRPRCPGYTDFWETRGATEFTILEPLAMWSHILAAGLDAHGVQVVACPGGPLTYAELLLARAMGARIAWLDPAAELSLPLDDLLPLGAGGVLEIPPDAMTIRAFLHRTRAPDEVREPIARFIHSEYRLAQLKPNRKTANDPALLPWDRLSPSLKASDFAQADDIPNKLAMVGKRLVKGGPPLELTAEQVEVLAEVEHGRFNVERLEAGWRSGDRHLRRLTSPHLKPWRDLDHEVQEYDREAIRNIRIALDDVGWGVVDT